MTLLDLCRLVRRYWVLVVALPVVCGVACFGYFSLPQDQTYTATARIVANSQVQGVVGLASSEARQAGATHPGVSVGAKGDTASYTVTVTASGPDADECVLVANEVAASVEAMAERFYRDNENPFEGHVEQARSAEGSAGGRMKYTLVALLAGLFAAICIVVVIDMVRRPVKSIEGVQEAVELPVLEKLPVADGGERLLANVRFAAKRDDLGSVCVVPVGGGEAAREACGLLLAAAGAEAVGAVAPVAAAAAAAPVEVAGSEASAVPLRAVAVEPFAKGMAGAYAARDADAVVIACRQWTDSMTALESTVAELNLAGANLVGIVFAPEGS